MSNITLAQGLVSSIDSYIDQVSEGHRLHRKIKFLLDIRGLLTINKVRGDYVEFGVFRGEMMYSASRILSASIDRFIGLDTFSGLPEPQGSDSEIFVHEVAGAMAAPRDVADELMSGINSLFIEGDFRESQIQGQFSALAPSIAVLVIDCNWPSSVEAAGQMAGGFLQAGSVIFVDDYFVGTRAKNFNDQMLNEIMSKQQFSLKEFMTYPPCARAFIVEP